MIFGFKPQRKRKIADLGLFISQRQQWESRRFEYNPQKMIASGVSVIFCHSTHLKNPKKTLILHS